MTKYQWRDKIIWFVCFSIASGVIRWLFPGLSDFKRFLYTTVVAGALSSVFHHLKPKTKEQLSREEQVNQDERHLSIRNQASFVTLQILLVAFGLNVVFGSAWIPEVAENVLLIALMCGVMVYFVSYYALQRRM